MSMYQRLADCLRRYGVVALFHGTTLAIIVAVAWWELLSFDLSRTPLAVVTACQCCVFTLWVAKVGTSWWRGTLSAIGLLGFASGLCWFMDGMPVPRHKLLFAEYPLDGTVLVVGVAL